MMPLDRFMEYGKEALDTVKEFQGSRSN
jgi:hypothetical protein